MDELHESPGPHGSWWRRTRVRVGRWILTESATAAGAAGIVVLAFAASAIVPIALEPFLIILTTNLPHLWRRFALCFSAGSVLGAVAVYFVGTFFLSTFGLAVIRFWGEEQAWARVLETAHSNWWLVPVAAVAVGPGPMKLVAMAAGAAGISFAPFLAVLVAGRLVRFFALALFSRKFGQTMHAWYVQGRRRAVFAAVAVLCVVLVVGWLAVRAFIY